MDINNMEASTARLRREGMVDALVNCLALLDQDALHRTIQQRVSDTASADDDPDREGALVREGVHDSYLACRRWVAQGLDGDALAARILQRIFAIWPHDAADYQRRYDEFLEKEFENPRATYYPSSHEWIAAVEDLRDEVRRTPTRWVRHPATRRRAAASSSCSPTPPTGPNRYPHPAPSIQRLRRCRAVPPHKVTRPVLDWLAPLSALAADAQGEVYNHFDRSRAVIQ